MRAVAEKIVLAAGLVAGCSLVPGPGEVPVDQLPVGVRVVTPPEQLRLQAINGTSILVRLIVNGTVQDLAPHEDADVTVAAFGPLPWDLRFTTSTGRELLHDTLQPGVISRTNHGDGTSEMTGFLARADLSCGQLFIVTNVASFGPAPGPGLPGDCD